MPHSHYLYTVVPKLDFDIELEIKYTAKQGAPASWNDPAEPHEFEVQEVLFLSQYGWAPWPHSGSDIEWMEEELDEKHDFSEPDYDYEEMY
jgi:hypothetical protein